MIPLKIYETVYQVTIDSMLDAIVVIDRDGKIMMVNEAWRKFSKENGLEPGKPTPGTEVGDNYFEACQPNAAITAEHSNKALNGIKAVLDGRLPSFNMEYPGHTLNQRHWFKMLVLPFSSDGQGVVITHSNITEFKLTEEALRLSEERWKFALEGSGDGVWDWYIQTGEALYSKRWKEMFGFTEPEIGNRSLEWSSRVHPDDIAGAMAAVEAHIDGKTPSITYEFRMLCKDRTYKWTLGRGMVISRDDNGQPLRLVGTNSDINDRKLMEKSLRLAQYSLDHAEEEIFWISSEARIVDANTLACKTLGYSREELIGLSVAVVDPVFPVENWSEHWQELKEKGSLRFESAHSTREGKIYPVEVLANYFEYEGEEYNCAFTRDITERKNAETALKEKEERLALATLHNGVGIWDWNLVTQELVWDDSMFALYNIRREDFSGVADAWEKALYPDDRERMDLELQDALSGSKPYDTEFRVVWPNGEVRHIKAVAKVFWDGYGKPLRLLGTNLDITERKYLEDELKRQTRTDFLTGLSSRGYFMEQGELELNRAIRYDNPFSIFMIDIDFFKQINDSHGHKVGDTVLKNLGQVCRQALRDVDIAGRLGGEEFAILLPETDKAEAAEVAERLREAISRSKVLLSSGEQPLHFTVSIGVASLASKGDNLDVLLNLADKALYEAKNSGRNRVCVAK